MFNIPQSHPDRGCPFCLELKSGMIDPQYQAFTRLHHRCLKRERKVAVLPSISPLRGGHVLLVPTKHISSAAQADAFTRRELVEVIEETARRVCGTTVEPLLFEHGVGRDLQGGCGIEHAHIHVLPVSKRERLRAEAAFEDSFALQEAGTLSDALTALSPEISYGLIGLPGNLRTTISELPSQTLRRCVADAIGSESTDWRELGSWDVMEETFVSLAT
jgi:diadenosine tetraphosphate (Ap4A) HIT family hydrolase